MAGWLVANGAQALPRHVTWHPELSQLVFSPLVEQESLRVHPPLVANTKLATRLNGMPTSLGQLGAKAAQAEVIALFPVPKFATEFGVVISASWEAFVAFIPNPNLQPDTAAASTAWKVIAGLRSPSHHNRSNGTQLGRYMPNTDLMGGDYNKNATTGRHYPPGTDPTVCQTECDKAAECVAWTYVIRGQPEGSGDCCLKKRAPTGHESALNLCPRLNARDCTSGVKTPTRQPATCSNGGGSNGHDITYSQALALLPTDSELEIRVFTDNSICEVFMMGGRVALTAPLVPESIEFGVFARSPTAMEVTVEAWSVDEIWVTPQEVIAG